jgi:hypothetical protein
VALRDVKGDVVLLGRPTVEAGGLPVNLVNTTVFQPTISEVAAPSKVAAAVTPTRPVLPILQSVESRPSLARARSVIDAFFSSAMWT